MFVVHVFTGSTGQGQEWGEVGSGVSPFLSEKTVCSVGCGESLIKEINKEKLQLALQEKKKTTNFVAPPIDCPFFGTSSKNLA